MRGEYICSKVKKPYLVAYHSRKKVYYGILDQGTTHCDVELKGVKNAIKFNVIPGWEDKMPGEIMDKHYWVDVHSLAGFRMVMIGDNRKMGERVQPEYWDYIEEVYDPYSAFLLKTACDNMDKAFESLLKKGTNK